MKTATKTIILSFFLLFSSLPVAFCDSDGSVNLLNIPEYLGEKLGVGTFAGGLLAGALVLVAFLMPAVLLAKGKGSALIFIIIIGLVLMGFEVAIAWLPVWLFTVVILMIALFGGLRAKDLI